MSQNEQIEAQGAAEEIPQAEIAESELESVSGGTAWMLVAGPSIIVAVPAAVESADS
jgi:hypothetical protein